MSTSRQQARRWRRACIQSVFVLALCRSAFAATPIDFGHDAQPVFLIPSPTAAIGPGESAAAPAGDGYSQWSAPPVTPGTEAWSPITTAHAGAAGTWNLGGGVSPSSGTIRAITYTIDHQTDGDLATTTFTNRVVRAGGLEIVLSGTLASGRDPVVTSDGHAEEGRVSYRWHGGGWESEIDIALASTDMGLSYGTTAFSSGTLVNRHILVASKAVEHDGGGQTTIASRFVVGRAVGDAMLDPVTYVYDRLSVSRDFRLRKDVTLTTALYGQIAQGGLFNSARLALDDLADVYPGNASLSPASEGVLAGQRVAGPLTDLGSLTGVHALDGDVVRGGVFWTYANLWQPGIVPASGARETLASAGVDLDCRLLSKVAVNAHVGWQVSKAPSLDHAGPFGRLALSFAF